MPEFLVPMSSPDITDAERQAVAQVLDTPFLSMGPRVQAFEQAVADYVGAKHAISVNSGTAGLHLCVCAAGIEAGDIVITTPFSFVASSNVILFENAIPVLVDVDPHTGNMDVELVTQAVTDLAAGGAAAQKWLPRKGGGGSKPVKAILPIDVFGQPYDAEPIIQLAHQHDLKVIEDACEAIGARYKESVAGKLGDYGVFAFYPNKQMTTGEGGVIVTDDDEAASLMRALRNQGRAPGDTWLQHTYLGYNYRMDEMSSALGAVQLGRLDELLDKRERVAGWYAERLAEIPLVETPQVQAHTTRMSWFVYVIRLAVEVDRDTLIEKLAAKGIPSRPYFAPIHLQPFMVERFGHRLGDFPVTEDLGRRSLALPFSGVMSEEQVELVCSTLRDVLAE
ncbi:MAG: DegT/DnrJ/EryC1/StrS family aminotransferase [Chloroflexi bacterium]|nr:MAG: DegT/DnrJ/EryC1/StrS family aminotransferase [Chloroflexota bacterium]MBL1194346.1 DegT/DnrJ/EryC1/StrS family aminotransferase [Chloroflexota bacterium]NOH11636.1 DegT/DnrJ/EryC1/StrS family aminotransferase [Chloroflexota bacterium]